MALYDAPVHRGYTVLTHTEHPLFKQNGFKQVGNTTLPKNPISSARVAPSALYNKNLSGVKGISEAGYGQRYPFRGLSYAGAGSPRSSVYRPGMGYAGAGSPRTSVLKGVSYAGAGSPRSSVYRPGMGYAGAGSPKTSVLRDAYINDNPPPGTLKVLSPKLSGLADDVPTAVDTGATMGPDLPAPETPTTASVWDSFTGAIGSIFKTTVSAGTQAADTSIIGAISGSGSTSPTKSTTILSKPAAKMILGMSEGTAMLLGVGALAYWAFKR